MRSCPLSLCSVTRKLLTITTAIQYCIFAKVPYYDVFRLSHSNDTMTVSQATALLGMRPLCSPLPEMCLTDYTSVLDAAHIYAPAKATDCGR